MRKVCSDQLVGAVVFPDHMLSRWPTACEGYSKYSDSLYGHHSKTDTLACLCHLHHEVSHEHGFRLPCVAAQLCLFKRRDSNSLHG